MEGKEAHYHQPPIVQTPQLYEKERYDRIRSRNFRCTRSIHLHYPATAGSRDCRGFRYSIGRRKEEGAPHGGKGRTRPPGPLLVRGVGASDLCEGVRTIVG